MGTGCLEWWVSKLDRGDGYTTLSMYWIPLSCVKMVNFMLCEFHFNEKKFNMSAYQDSLKKIKRKVINWEIYVKQILNNMARIKNKKRMPIAHKETKPLKTKDIKHLFTEEETFKKCSTS